MLKSSSSSKYFLFHLLNFLLLFKANPVTEIEIYVLTYKPINLHDDPQTNTSIVISLTQFARALSTFCNWLCSHHWISSLDIEYLIAATDRHQTITMWDDEVFPICRNKTAIEVFLWFRLALIAWNKCEFCCLQSETLLQALERWRNGCVRLEGRVEVKTTKLFLSGVTNYAADAHLLSHLMIYVGRPNKVERNIEIHFVHFVTGQSFSATRRW